jgi:Carboxypeptidase regulatory-like domain/TonB dependent receptor-like, beta-barrel
MRPKQLVQSSAVRVESFSRRPFKICVLLLLIICFLAAQSTFAQGLDGTIRGTVRDASDALVPGVLVTVKNEGTGSVRSTETTAVGTYNFPNLLIGTYSVSAEMKGFKKYVRQQVEVRANQVVEADISIELGEFTTVVEVVAGRKLVQTTTSQLASTISGKAITDLPNFGNLGDASPYALAIITPGVTTQGGGILGEGGSIGGNRPRNNNFTIDGVDNNRLDITGTAVPVIADAVQEFNLLTNQFSAEYGHSTAGQFNIITKSGTNDLHGTAFFFGNNRKLNAFDNLEKSDLRDGVIDGKRRYDFARTGATVGGPIIKDKLFFFGAYQYQTLGRAATGSTAETVTAQGLSTIKSIPGLSQNNVDIISNSSIWPVAAAPNGGFQDVRGSDGSTRQVEMGNVIGSAPDFFNQHDWQSNIDYNRGSQQFRGRFLYDRYRSPNIGDFPFAPFTGDYGADTRLFTFSHVWTLNPNVINDFRVQYRRLNQTYAVPDQFASFPNLDISSLGLFVGPQGDSPQSTIENAYQIIDNISWTRGRHNFKFGAEFRKWISPGDFLPRSRGEYDWESLQSFLYDEIPAGTNGVLRGVGTGKFADNRNAFYGFFQDDFKIHPRLTLNLGLRYEYTGNPRDANTQELNSIASVPGVIEFRKPKTDKNDWAPRLGFAWDLFGTGKTSLRGGAGIGYDVLFGNLVILQLPPQFQQEMNAEASCLLSTPPAYCSGGQPVGPPTAAGFLASGGLPTTPIPPDTADAARSGTQALIVDTVHPTTYTWSLSLQQELHKDWVVEGRYVGTRGLKLPIQTRLNAAVPIPEGSRLPTYLSASEVPANAGGAPSLADIMNYPGANTLFYESLGFNGGYVTAFEPVGNSIYHGASLDVQRRAAKGLYFRGGYTWSHVIDDSTNELNSGKVNPRRPENFLNLQNERGNSALDRRHHFTLAWSYELPKFGGSNAFMSKVLGGWQLTGIYLAESGQWITPQSGRDIDNNFDSAADRVVVNPNGDPKLGTDTSLVVRNPVTGATSISVSDPGDDTTVVGYVAQNPNAKWIATQLGGRTNSGRNVIDTKGLNNWNLGVFKNTYISETKYIQFRLDMINAFNHRQYSLAGDPKTGGGTIFQQDNNTNAQTSAFGIAAATNFLNPYSFNGGGRILTLGLKFFF